MGIGYEIVRGLALRGYDVVLTSRAAERSHNAVTALKGDLMKHSGEGGTGVKDTSVGSVRGMVLDVGSEVSVEAFKSTLEGVSGFDGVDVLVNNAGIAYSGPEYGAPEAAHTLDINYHGTRRVTESLLPFLKQGGDPETNTNTNNNNNNNNNGNGNGNGNGNENENYVDSTSPPDEMSSSLGVKIPLLEGPSRVINVASRAGRITQVSEELAGAFSDPSLDVDGLKVLLDSFVDSIRAGSVEKDGWSSSMYGISKLAQIAYTRILAREHPDLNVTAVCPGWVRTQLSSYRGIKTPDEGADSIIWLATHNPPLESGGYYAERGPIPWEASL